jgi:glutamate formiminotransferase / formiminotetrahydrofolate cyclodeaminase
MKWMECVPNFSEGRNPAAIEAIAAAMRQVEGAHLLHVDPERDTNRCVMTLMGSPEALEKALFEGIRVATEILDLREHRGSHPRMGVADVVPFVPWLGTDVADCIAVAERVGHRVGEALDLPGWFYGAAARQPENSYLHDIRRGQFEGLSRKLEGKAPDFGPRSAHPSAGAIAVGARPVLVAMNCTLDSDDVRLAKDLAARIREFQHVRRSTDGSVHSRSKVGLPGLRAMGWFSARDSRAQVTMNLTNTQDAPPHRVFEALDRLCALTRTSILGTELVGMIPEALLAEAGQHFSPSSADSVSIGIQKLRLGVLHEFDPEDRIIERVMTQRGLGG